jgi:hypothetical protein
VRGAIFEAASRQRYPQAGVASSTNPTGQQVKDVKEMCKNSYFIFRASHQKKFLGNRLTAATTIGSVFI